MNARPWQSQAVKIGVTRQAAQFTHKLDELQHVAERVAVLRQIILVRMDATRTILEQSFRCKRS
jgi:ABC-type uncharacterized transport system ATPase subunit